MISLDLKRAVQVVLKMEMLKLFRFSSLFKLSFNYNVMSTPLRVRKNMLIYWKM